MNRKQFIILLGLVVVIGAAGLFVRRQSNDSWRSGGSAIGQKLLPNLAVNDIAQITIKAGTNELTLAKRDNLWRVHERADYPANFADISSLLMKLADLKIVQTEDIGPSQLGRFELLPPGVAANTGTQLDLKDQTGKPLNSLLLGKKHLAKPPKNPQFAGMGDEGWPDGRYVMAGGAKSAAVISDPLESVQPKPEQWLAKDFLNIEKPRSIAVQFPEATNSWKLTRASDTNDWQLADAQAGEKLDSSKISSVTNPFGSPTFNDVAAVGTSSAAGNTVLTVETFDGFSYVAKIAPKQEETYPVTFSISANLANERPAAKGEKPEDKAKLDKQFKEQQARLAEKLTKETAFTNWTFQLPASIVDEILKPRLQLLVEASTNTPPQPEK
jgi:hypothetical protein